MVVKVYISGISGNKEVKKRQQRVLMILDSKTIKYSIVDITEPGQEAEKDFMQNNSTCKGATIGDANPRHPLPPQIFNESEYCGDYDQFDTANEIDTLEQFLKLEPGEVPQISVDSNIDEEKIQDNGMANGEIKKDNSIEKELSPDIIESSTGLEKAADDLEEIEKDMEEKNKDFNEEIINAEAETESEQEEDSN